MRGYRGASRGFPPACDEESETPFPPSDTLPYTEREIEEYLHRNHYHLCLDEPPTRFSSTRLVAQIGEAGRRFWGLEARDEAGRSWFVLVGSGVSFLRPDRYMRRWMLGMLPDGSLSWEQMLEAEIEDQLEHDGRWLGDADQEMIGPVGSTH